MVHAMIPQCLYALPDTDDHDNDLVASEEVVVVASSTSFSTDNKQQEELTLQKIPILHKPQPRQLLDDNDACYQCYCSSPLADMIVEEEEDASTTASTASSRTTTSILPPILEMENEDGSIPEITATSSDSSDATTVVTNLTSSTKQKRQEEGTLTSGSGEAKDEEEKVKEEETQSMEETNNHNHNKFQIILPPWLITGDDIAQIVPESCGPPIRYMEDHCICQRMPDHDDNSFSVKDEETKTKCDDGGNSIVVLDQFVSITPTMMQHDLQEEEEEKDGENNNNNDGPCSSYNTVLKTLRARAPLEAPNPKKPGESKFLEEDMMDLLETV